MPFYYSLNDQTTEEAQRIATNLLRLRESLKQEIPEKSVDERLLLCTWNIREFESGKYGPRLDESLFYIAEIISRFDLVAIQEVKSDLTSFDRVMHLLGGYWKYVITDVTLGTAGNDERIAFVFDSRKVNFGGLAGEVVLPATDRIDGDKDFSRTPFVTGWKSGWFKFLLCSVHVFYGKAKADDPRRIAEIDLIAKHFASQAKKAKNARTKAEILKTGIWSNNVILLGDFNIFQRTDATFQALEKHGFEMPATHMTNLGQNKHFDQIAFLPREHGGGVELADIFGEDKRPSSGVFRFFDHVFRDEDEARYEPVMVEEKARTNSKSKNPWKYKDWRTHQMSDHLPLWIELQTDFADIYLNNVKDAPAREKPAGANKAPSQAGS
jgi:exonuclease III